MHRSPNEPGFAAARLITGYQNSDARMQAVVALVNIKNADIARFSIPAI
jgi:hypothetical protein